MKIIGLILLIFLSSCSSPTHNHTLKISVNKWIGYTPLFYAKEKGWLEEIDVKLINVSSLSENGYLYKAGISDAYCGTQYEYTILKKQISNIMPIILFNRSNGGDIIMSNRSIKELQSNKKKIYTYLEMDSINFEILKDFINKYKIDESRIEYINRDQLEITTVKNNDPSKQILIVTYIPFDTKLKQNGFKQIASTKDGINFLIIDALFIQEEKFLFHKKQFIKLKRLIDNAIAAIHKDPKEFYETIKPYMDGLDYKGFTQALDKIEWINKDLNKELKKRMIENSFPVKGLL